MHPNQAFERARALQISLGSIILWNVRVRNYQLLLAITDDLRQYDRFLVYAFFPGCG